MLGVQSGWGREGKWSLSPLTDDIDNGVVAPALRCAHLTLKDTWRKWEWRYWAPPAPLGGWALESLVQSCTLLHSN